MATYKIGFVRATRTVLFSIMPDTLPATFEGNAVTMLPDFVHAADNDSLPGQKHGYVHTIYNHVQEALYHTRESNGTQGAKSPDGIYDMQTITIEAHGDLAKANGLKARGLVIEEGATAPSAIKFLPEGNAAAATNFDFVSADTGVATVAATGVITAVVAGETTIKATLKDLRYSVVFPVTVTEPEEDPEDP